MKSYLYKSLFLFLLLTCSALAIPKEAVEFAKRGDYKSAVEILDKYQPTDAADRRRKLLLEMSIAHARYDVATLTRAGDELEQALKGVDEPEVAMRLYLIRGAAANRIGEVKTASEAMAKARPIAQRLAAKGDPGGALGLAECNSAAYMASLLINGQPEPTAYSKACEAAYKPAFECPATLERPLWPLDGLRTTYWSRLWVWQAGHYEYLAYRKDDSILYNAWYTAATGISNFAATAYYQTFQQTQNAEWAIAAMHLILESAEAFPMVISESQIVTAGSQINQFPATQEGLQLRGRMARAAARWYLFSAKDPKTAMSQYQQAAKCFQDGGYWIDAMDIWGETAYLYLLDSLPKPGWESAVKTNLGLLTAKSKELNYPIGRYFGLGFNGAMNARSGKLVEAERDLAEALNSGLELAAAANPTARSEIVSQPEMKFFADTLLEMLVKQNRTQDALEWTQRLSAEAEISGLDLDRVKRNPATDQALKTISEGRRERGELQAQLQSAKSSGDQALATRLEGELASNRAEFQKTINTLRQQDPDFERLLSVRPSSFSKLQSSLPPEVVLVAYYPSEERMLIFVVTKEDLKILPTPLGRAKLSEAVSALRSQVMKIGRVDKSVSDELYRGLISPLEPLMATHSVLTVIPSGMLYYLPFSALTDPQGQPLAGRIAVNLITATEMPELSQAGDAHSPGTLLALANPDGSLPGASQEVKDLAPLFKNSRTYEGKEASEDKLDGRSEVLHLATHGILNSANVNESYLQMADGQLTTGEIYGLDLQNVSLVTLSACRTALGEKNPGSEVATLAQAFSVAGSRSVLASLWPVDDDATARLMLEFYKGLVAGKNKAEALRAAQLVVREQPRWQHPYYWSSFELIGDWR